LLAQLVLPCKIITLDPHSSRLSELIVEISARRAGQHHRSSDQPDRAVPAPGIGPPTKPHRRQPKKARSTPDACRNLTELVRVWIGQYEAGAFDEDARVADAMQAYEARIAALERLAGKQSLELELLQGAQLHGPLPPSAPLWVITGPVASPSPKAVG
jgi:transposase